MGSLALPGAMVATVVAGVWVGRWTNRLDLPAARLLIYVLVPVVVAHSIANSQAGVMHILGYAVALYGLMGVTGLLLPFRATPAIRFTAFGYYNVGAMGLPLSHLLLGPESLAVMAAAYLGCMLFGNTICLGVLAGGGVRAAMRHTLLMPPVHAFVLGLADRHHAVIPWTSVEPLVDNVRLAMSVLGMLLVGLGIARVPRHAWAAATLFGLTRQGLSLAFGLAGVTLAAPWLTATEQRSLVLLSLLPVAVNLVALSGALGRDLRAPSAVVSVSTLLSCASVLVWVLIAAPEGS